YTQCPDVCPTTLQELLEVKQALGADGDKLQAVFVSLDPERDTPEVLDAYVKAFDPSFEALYGTPEEIAVAAKEFGIFYEKIPAGDTYTLSHTATSFVFDTRSNLRLGLSVFLSADPESARQLLREKRRFRAQERRLAHAHVSRLQRKIVQSIETSSLHLELIADMKRLNSLFCSSAYVVLETSETGALAVDNIADITHSP
ncbi:MAG: SCO family protein, partial [Pseudomonas sp.]